MYHLWFKAIEEKNTFVEKYNCPFLWCFYMENSFKGQMENFGILKGENESKKKENNGNYN
jgi:hypothetical protein